MSGPKPPAERPAARARPDLPRRLGQALDSLLPPGATPRWVVAFSGGADSLALLAALVEVIGARPAARRPALRAVHVDHGLNPRSGDWARQCRRICRALGVPLSVARARLRVPRGASVEAVAREARYALLRRALRRGEVLLTAHHVDDQLETLLLQLMRGAGVAGLASMPPVAAFGRGWLLRPLLGLRRAELREYVAGRGLAWVEDDSNVDPRFDRNFLRREVLPALQSRWPAAAEVAARSAAHLAEARMVLDELAACDLARLRRGTALDVERLQALSAPRRKLAVRAWLASLGLPVPDSRHLARVTGELCQARRDAQPRVDWPGVEVRRYRGRLFAAPTSLPARAPAPPGTGSPGSLRWNWRRRAVLPLGPGLGRLELRRDPRGPLDASRLPATLQVGWRAGGERLRTEPGGPRRAVKELLRSAGVLPWMRGLVPLVQATDRLVAVADLAVEADYLAAPGCRSRCRLQWLDAPEHRLIDADVDADAD